MLSNIEIAQKTKLEHIEKVASKIGIKDEQLNKYGKYAAKISANLLKKLKNKKDGKLILVTAMTPTKAGEGKTTTTVGLSQALWKLGKKNIACLREPSLGPVMGVKGGACGGGYSQVLPMEDINLFFTGDIPAVTMAHNLLSAVIDNHIYQGNRLEINPKKVFWRRVMDMNDRALRKIKVKINDEISRDDAFDITVASEVMAVLCLSENISDLKKRLSKMIVGLDKKRKLLKVNDLKVSGAMAALLKHAVNPNIVQTAEHTPAFVHGGPFANIAHGCSSMIATKLALKLSDYVVTEAGFGSDLGAEKFFDIKCRIGNLKPNAVVLVASIRALRMHGNSKDYSKKDLEAVKKGLSNLQKHIENIRKFNLPLVVAVNEFPTDSNEEVNEVIKFCRKNKVTAIISEVAEKGGKGGINLAKEVLKLIKKNKNNFKFLYNSNKSIREKIDTIAKEIYGAEGVSYSKDADEDIDFMEKRGYGNLPVCMAKTQNSLSDNPKLLGRPKNFKINVTRVNLRNGAGFLVVYCGNIMTMPGLPKKPAAEGIDIDDEGKISGLF